MDKGEPQQVSPFFIEDATNMRQYLHHLANLMGEINTHIKKNLYLCFCSDFLVVAYC